MRQTNEVRESGPWAEIGSRGNRGPTVTGNFAKSTAGQRYATRTSAKVCPPNLCRNLARR